MTDESKISCELQLCYKLNINKGMQSPSYPWHPQLKIFKKYRRIRQHIFALCLDAYLEEFEEFARVYRLHRQNREHK